MEQVTAAHQLSLVRFSLKDLEKDYEKTEDDIKAVQSVGQIIGEVMKQLDDDRCECCHFISLIIC
jgi:26S proteasome regulatory subunit T4